jgi:hypothetical protein
MDDDPYYQDDADALEAINQLEGAQEHEDIAEVDEPPAAAEIAQPPGPTAPGLCPKTELEKTPNHQAYVHVGASHRAPRPLGHILTRRLSSRVGAPTAYHSSLTVRQEQA